MISTSPECASGTILSSGSSLTFGTEAGMLAVGRYYYCATFSDAPSSGLAAFTVTWTQSTAVSTIGCGHNVSCNIQSNATLSNLRFAGVTIHVEADGSSGAHGYANVTVPKMDIPNINELHVFVDNSKLSSSAVVLSSNSTDYFIYFTFTFHSPVLIDIQLTVPENAATPTILGLDPTLFYEIVEVLIAVIVIVSAALVVHRRGRTRPTI